MTFLIQKGFSCVDSFRQIVTGAVYGTPDPFLIDGSKETLQDAIEVHGKDVLQCKFKENYQTYSAFEYAVKLGDRKSAQDLISLGACVDDSKRSFGTMVHFFVDCLEENTEPDLELLELLLDNISDVSLRDAGDFCTSLEHALKHMANYKEIRWNVIELLLKKGVSITEEYSTPFKVLQDSFSCEYLHGHRVPKSPEKEREYFNKLTKYLELEKKYHPNSESGLTFEEFNENSSAIKSSFRMRLSEMGTSDFFSGSVEDLVDDINTELGKINNPPSYDEQEQYAEVISEASNAREEVLEKQRQLGVAIRSELHCYHHWFNGLVADGDFKQCFTEWELNQIKPLLSGNSMESAVLRFLLFRDVS